MVDLLMQHADKAIIESSDVYGEKPLYMAVKRRDTDLAKHLIEKYNANVNGVCDGNGLAMKTNGTPLHAAVENGDLVTAKMLLEKGADPDLLVSANFGIFCDKCTPLGLAKIYGKEEMIDLLGRFSRVRTQDASEPLLSRLTDTYSVNFVEQNHLRESGASSSQEPMRR